MQTYCYLILRLDQCVEYYAPILSNLEKTRRSFFRTKGSCEKYIKPVVIQWLLPGKCV